MPQMAAFINIESVIIIALCVDSRPVRRFVCVTGCSFVLTHCSDAEVGTQHGTMDEGLWLWYGSMKITVALPHLHPAQFHPLA